MMPLEVDANRQRRWFTANRHLIAIDTVVWTDNIPALRDALLLDQYADLLHVVAMILGADQNWTPAENGIVAQLTHTLSRKGDSSHQLALNVPVEAQTRLEVVVNSLSSELNVVPHRQQLVLGADIPPISAADAELLQAPGAMLLLGNVGSDNCEMVLRSDSSRYICRHHASQTTLEILASEEVTSQVHGEEPVTGKSEIRFLKRLEYDLRAFTIGAQITSPIYLQAGVQLEVHVEQTNSASIVASGTVVRLGHSLALLTDTPNSRVVNSAD